MIQLVNMYQPVFRRQPKLLSAATLMAIIAVAMVLMAALYFNAHSTMRGLLRTSADLSLHFTQLDARLAAVTSNATLSINESSNDEIDILQAEINDRNALLDRIDSLFIESSAGFGGIFETLAQTNLSGLWLTGIQLDQDGSIEISGTTLDPRLVPRYLQLITKHSPLAILNSGTVDLEREESDQTEINFVLSYNTIGEQQ